MLDPLLEQAYLELAQYYNSKRLYDKAEEILQRAMDRGVGTPLVLIRLSQAAVRPHELRGRRQERGIEGSADDPTIVDGYLAIGSGYYELGLYNDAVWPLQTYTLYASQDPAGLELSGPRPGPHRGYRRRSIGRGSGTDPQRSACAGLPWPGLLLPPAE